MSPSLNPKSVHYHKGKSKHTNKNTQGKGNARKGGGRAGEKGRQGKWGGTGDGHRKERAGEGRVPGSPNVKQKNSVKNLISVCQTESRD